MKNSVKTIVAVIIVSLLLPEFVKAQVSNDIPKETIRLIKTENRSCMSDQAESSPPKNTDSLYYSIKGDTLIVNMMLYRNCASVNKDSVVIINEKVGVFIQNVSTRKAKCNCYFCFAFYFTDFTKGSNFQLFYKGNKDNDFSLKGNYYLP
jgi:hypothetical protein